jgi:hypothetical protein
VKGIAAASAAVVQCPSTSELTSVLAFAQVISALHAQCAVLPMRFGSCATSLEILTEMLALRVATFRAALDRIDGSEEMSLRAVWSAPELERKHPHRQPANHGEADAMANAPSSAGAARSGTLYLARLRARYDERKVSDQVRERAVETFKSAFAGLFMSYQAEASEDPDEISLSLHFLTQRRDHELFVSAFRQLRDHCQTRLLLTGPWPPYHFSAALSTLDGPVLTH